MKKPAWPKIRFREKGRPKPSGGVGYPGFGWELHFYDFLQRWNGGVPLLDSFKVKNCHDQYTVARVKYFFGISDRDDERDLRNVVYYSWNDLPRGAIPIAQIDIEEDEWDRCLLLTFGWGDNYNKIYLLAHLHDCGPYDPDDLSELQYVARSLPEFMKKLESHDALYFRTWFQLPVPFAEIRPVADAILNTGLEDWGGFSELESDECVQAYSEDPKYTLWCAKPGVTLDGIAAPKKMPKDSCAFAIDAFQWNHTAALRHVKSALKPLKLDRKLKKVGVTAVTS